ncbi:hypothetical protein CspeluHIS016_0703890 [Cutaneotrichosporon spelunceum]|uniref:EF-hand domain-containing protein n=1 Tax=Cutaneotrichosporon spelunceum TaxID=1672016 RepID=A0AAD3TZF9_9TREE|nr:hypothetical protein CspeluHIS016_0703890 [Cutaneotrichosporon spelunceum]
MEDDPEFLELSVRQRRAINRAFERGLRAAKGRPSKRRRLNNSGPTTGTTAPAAEEGGFVDDGGGFIPEYGGGFLDDSGGFIPEDGGGFVDDSGGFMPDDDAGGFLPDDSGGGFMSDDGGGGGGFVLDNDDGGGFIPDNLGPSAGPSTTRASRAVSTDADAGTDVDEHIPLRLIPTLLSSLGLPSDEDVLSVFRSMGEDGVRRKDFRAVCAALMPPDAGQVSEDETGDREGGQDEEDGDWDMISGSDSDAFEPSDDSDFGAPVKGKKATRRAKALEDTGVARLSSRQREAARTLWALLKPDEKGASGILSRDEVKRWARELGEMWSDAEITDMVTLFSGQPEGRGLTFEDFGVVMLRAGLV